MTAVTAVPAVITLLPESLPLRVVALAGSLVVPSVRLPAILISAGPRCGLSPERLASGLPVAGVLAAPVTALRLSATGILAAAVTALRPGTARILPAPVTALRPGTTGILAAAVTALGPGTTGILAAVGLRPALPVLPLAVLALAVFRLAAWNTATVPVPVRRDTLRPATAGAGLRIARPFRAGTSGHRSRHAGSLPRS